LSLKFKKGRISLGKGELMNYMEIQLTKKENTLGPYQINKVYQANCYNALIQMPDRCVDAAITSPPYWGQRGDGGIGAEEDPREYLKNLNKILIEVMRVIKIDGLLWLNIGDAYNTPINWGPDDYIYSSLGPEGRGLNANNSAYTKNRGCRRAFINEDEKWLQYGNLLALPYRIVTALCDQGILFRGEVIWAKRNPMPEGKARRPHRKHEGIYIFANSERHKFRTQPPVSSVWDLKPNANETQHTSTFPIHLPITCIQAMELKNGIVIDPFMGSGTVGLAAKKLGLDYIGFELNPKNVATANKRIEESNWSLEMPLGV
jgi:DNA modification methylase